MEIPPLTSGSHDSPDDGLCLLEAVALLAGEAHTDRPACASPVLAGYGRTINDTLLPEREDLEPRLRALAPRLVGTAGQPELDRQAGLIAMRWPIQVYLPTLLTSAGLGEHAQSLEGAARDVLPAAELRAAAKAAVRAATPAPRGAGVKDVLRIFWAAREAVMVAVSREARWQYAVHADVSAAAGAAAQIIGDVGPVVRELQESALALYERMICLYDAMSRPTCATCRLADDGCASTPHPPHPPKEQS